ncbi:metallopeptidase [Bacillus coahuilensis p1.1.43]|uniref:Metallopeptidase n=2 Tax=Bacillus coahuilensis TaxID=408580 RepID=A0A147KB61_9BACI|nr:Xaa-Pro peptidase family protein [Bacillus coahuilensis]KUP08124.1 metallopeptidase [Bacillus coahuilensis p1.1.43]
MKDVQNLLAEKNIDVAFFNSTENVFYLSGFYTDPHERLMGMFLFKKSAFVLPAMEVDQLQGTGWSYDSIGYYDHNPWELIEKKLGTKLIQSIGLESEVLNYKRSESLLALFPGSHVSFLEEIINPLRVVKDENKIATMKKAAELADFGVEVGINTLQEGITEMEVLAKIEYELKKKGVKEMSFSTMVLFGEHAGEPHGKPGNRKLKKGDFVLFDLGVVLDGYCSDISRTVAFDSVSERQKELYDLVFSAQAAALAESKPGTRIGDLDKVARDLISNAGYGEYFPHRIGHGIGINVHEYPSMSHLNDHLLEENMVFTIEPGVYVPEVGGVRIEDDVVITKDGYKALTAFPKELLVVSSKKH